MRLKINSSEKKLRGEYYTPTKLATAIVDLFCNEKIEKILEPSCGDGVFIEALSEKGFLKGDTQLTAIEVERSAAEKVSQQFSSLNVETVVGDFFEYYNSHKGHKFDLIVGNPPYIRYQYLTSKQRKVLSEILTSQHMKSNKLINAWVGFMVACTTLLAETGKLAFVIPAEVLQVVYAEDLRVFLSNNFSKITLLTFEKLVFDDIEQEVLVFVGEKGSGHSEIKIAQLGNLDDLKHFDLEANGFQPLLDAYEKWTKYFLSSEEIDLMKNLKNDSRLVRFDDLALINVGITTGNNKFFSIDGETAKKYDLQPLLVPLVGRSAHASGIFFNTEDWENNVVGGKRAQLLVLEEGQEKNLSSIQLSYLTSGEKNGESSGYKCSIRNSWYAIPSVWTPDAFFLRRNNLYPKLVLNECDAVSTDTMHRIKLKPGINSRLMLLSYYNSISFAYTELCGRSYGGGVLEILPREVGSILLPIVNSIDENLIEELLAKVDDIVRKKTDIEQALDLVDETILVKALGFNQDICDSCRLIWKNLQKRRLGRGRS